MSKKPLKPKKKMQIAVIYDPLGPSAKEFMTITDGTTNPAALTGEASILTSDGIHARSGMNDQTELLMVNYRESWLAKKIVDMPSEDMTRKWYTLNTSMTPEQMKALRNLETRCSVRRKLTNGIRWARLFGGSIVVMNIKDGKELSEPLNLKTLRPGCFCGLLVLDRTQGIIPSTETEENLNDPDYGEPMYYDVDLEDGHQRIHHSRVLKFNGRELPSTDRGTENSWGASELEHIWEELQKRNAASADIVQLMFQAKITTLKISDLGERLMAGTDLQRRIIMENMETMNRLRTSYGILPLSSKDEAENRMFSFAGISRIYEVFMTDMAGATGIPATKLFGRPPEGFNASGESDLRNYAEMISGLQERMLRPALEKLLPVMTISCMGFVPENMDIIFEPLIVPTPTEQAEIIHKLSMSVLEAFKSGVMSKEEACRELKARGAPYGVWTKLSNKASETKGGH